MAPGTADAADAAAQPVPGAAAPQPDASAGTAPASGEPASGSFIEIGDFAKVQLRVGKVLAAERVPKSKKLLKLTVQDSPSTERTILAGLAESYTPEEIMGRTIVFVANLKPRPMMGLVSHGMVLAAEADGRAQLLSFDVPPAPGTEVR